VKPLWHEGKNKNEHKQKIEQFSDYMGSKTSQKLYI